jgi:hypothetical protein
MARIVFDPESAKGPESHGESPHPIEAPTPVPRQSSGVLTSPDESVIGR